MKTTERWTNIFGTTTSSPSDREQNESQISETGYNFFLSKPDQSYNRKLKEILWNAL